MEKLRNFHIIICPLQLKNKAGDTLYFYYRQQIPQEYQNQQSISIILSDPPNTWLLAISPCFLQQMQTFKMGHKYIF